MPNWCYNMIEVFDSVEDHPNRDKFFTNADLEIPDNTPLQKFIPMSDYHKTHEGYNDGGYEWCLINWGTKWPENDLFITHESPVSIEMTFDSPWGPPIEGYETISGMFPQLFFLHYWQEDGMAFAGSAVYHNGRTIFQKESDMNDWPEWDEDNPDDYHQKLADLHSSLIGEAERLLQQKMRIE